MQNTDIVKSYDYYTLEQPKEIVKKRIGKKSKEQNDRREEKTERIYYIKQRLSGLTMTAIGIFTPFLLDGDATFSLIALPLGLFLVFTKEKVMMF